MHKWARQRQGQGSQKPKEKTKEEDSLDAKVVAVKGDEVADRGVALHHRGLLPARVEADRAVGQLRRRKAAENANEKRIHAEKQQQRCRHNTNSGQQHK